MPKVSTTQEFITKSNLIHKGAYNYLKVVYIGSKSKVIIICEKHGEFKQTPSHHLQGKGCKKCGGISSKTKQLLNAEVFINKCNRVHNSKYNYSELHYRGMKEDITITCPNHGNYIQKAEVHLRGCGCPKCGNNFRCNTVEFKKAACRIHNKKYNYDLLGYVNSKTLIRIICSIHGEFKQRASAHLLGQGCPSCSISRFSLTSKAYLYYIKYKGFYKIGVTNRSIRLRYPCIYRKLEVLSILEYSTGEEALKQEQLIKNTYMQFRCKGLNPITNTISTEVFEKDIFNLKN